MFNKISRVRILLTVVFGIFSLPMFFFGAWFWILWIGAHLGKTTYLDHPYFLTGAIFLLSAIVTLLIVLYAAWRRSYRGVLFLIPVLVGFTAMIIIPEVGPYDVNGANHISAILGGIRRYHYQRGTFPQTENALQDAVGARFAELSSYINRGQPLPYHLVFIRDANGLALPPPGETPGVVYYAVSPDARTVWIGVTELKKPVGGEVQFRQLNYDDRKNPCIIKLTSN